MASSQISLSVRMKPLVSLLIVSFVNQAFAFHSLPFTTRLQLHRSIPIRSGERIGPLRETEDANILDFETIDDVDDANNSKEELKTVSARYVNDNDLVIVTPILSTKAFSQDKCHFYVVSVNVQLTRSSAPRCKCRI